jgi:ABC-type protease/lipase transport system fused ATPase/permease subunit
LKEERRTVVIISHRHVSLNTVDKLLCLNGGAMAIFGPRKDVLAQLGVKSAAVPTLAVVQ